MRTGLKFWRVRQLALAGLSAIAILTGNPGSGTAQTDALPDVTWESRWTEETSDGDLVDHPPYVAVKDIRLSRFSEMQTVTWRNTLTIDQGDDGIEKLFVFTVWQGGASQSEQLMLLSVRPQGIAVVGPYTQDFETLEIDHTSSESAPQFGLMGADGTVLVNLTYLSGELVK